MTYINFTSKLTSFITPVVTMMIVRLLDRESVLVSSDTHLALAIVAIEMPVEPTVPSNIRDPVCGYRRPCRSASSITI